MGLFKTIKGTIDEKPENNIKIVDTKKRGKKVSLITRVDAGFISNLLEQQNQIGKFLDLEVDTENLTITLHFEKI